MTLTTDERRTRDGSRDPDHHPLERAVDKKGLRGHFARVNAIVAEFRTLFFLAGGILLWLGWTQKSPGARITDVEKKIEDVRLETADSLSSVKKEVETVKIGQTRTHDALEVLVRLRCFDTTLSARDMRLVGLDCSDITQARAARGTPHLDSATIIRQP